MGVIMEKRVKQFIWIFAIGIFIVVPSLIYSLGYFPRRSFLKETISLLTLLSFFVMILMFYLSRINRSTLKPFKMAKVLKWHKALGYTFVGILIFHPFFVIVPRYFEAGISPGDAFSEILSNLDKQGLLFGLIAWSTMILLGVTSFFRDKLPMTYKTWRILHGILSLVFLFLASLHVIQTGRHMSVTFISLILLLSGIGIAMLIRRYILDSTSEKS